MREDFSKTTDVAILCGGFGTRLSAVVADRPKPMADFAGKPFLDILIDYVSEFGLRRIILCTGYLSYFIRRHYRHNRKKNVDILFSEETTPLGTAGAVKNAEKFVEARRVLCLNGDSLCRVNLDGLLSFHRDKKAFASIALSGALAAPDHGVVKTDLSGRILSFSEKPSNEGMMPSAMGMMPSTGGGLVNAGVYVFEREVFNEILPGKKLSLEYDIFPAILEKGVYGYQTDGDILDIGTPERLKKARGALLEGNL